jgi:hypothetical protein
MRDPTKTLSAHSTLLLRCNPLLLLFHISTFMLYVVIVSSSAVLLLAAVRTSAKY